jgi:hypothetical protein
MIGGPTSFRGSFSPPVFPGDLEPEALGFGNLRPLEFGVVRPLGFGSQNEWRE